MNDRKYLLLHLNLKKEECWKQTWSFKIKHGYTLFKKEGATLQRAGYTRMFSVTTLPSNILIIR